MFYSLNSLSIEKFSIYFNSLLIISLILILGLILKNFKLNTKLRLSNKKLLCLENSNKTISNLNDSIRGFKHDFNNIVQTLGGYICLDDVEGLKKYYKSLTTDFYNIKNINLINLNDIKNPALFSLISSKIPVANECGVEINFASFADLSKMDVDMFEYCRILGILIDNAIEAASNCNKKLVNINFYEDDNGEFIHCLVENTYNEKNINVKSIYNKNYSTKSSTGNRGLGLWNVQEILKMNPNIKLVTKTDEVFFRQTLSVICKEVRVEESEKVMKTFGREKLK